MRSQRFSRCSSSRSSSRPRPPHRRYNDRWEDASLENIARQHQHQLDALKRLESIPRAQLPPADQLNYDLFKKDLDNDIEGYKFKLYLLPVNQRGGVQSVDEIA